MKRLFGIALVLLLLAPCVFAQDSQSERQAIINALENTDQQLLKWELASINNEKLQADCKKEIENSKKEIENSAKVSKEQEQRLQEQQQRLTNLEAEHEMLQTEYEKLEKQSEVLYRRLASLESRNRILTVVGGVALLVAIVEGVILFTQD